MASKQITEGSKVSFQYRQHYLLGGGLISGNGVITGRTVVGSDDAWIIHSFSEAIRAQERKALRPCDCTVYCSDDPDIRRGTAAMCERATAAHQAEQQRLQAARKTAHLLNCAPDLLAELQAAHQLLVLALKHMTIGSKAMFADEAGRLGISPEGATRHAERTAVIARTTQVVA